MPAFPVLNPQPVSVQELPLPDGAATESGLVAILAELQGKTEPGNTQAVSAASLPLPAGAATEANQNTANTALAAIQATTALAAFGVNDVDEASATLTYVGCEDKDGTWLVKKIDTSSGTSIRFATAGIIANAAYTNYGDAWDDRATLTYGTFAEAF